MSKYQGAAFLGGMYSSFLLLVCGGVRWDGFFRVAYSALSVSALFAMTVLACPRTFDAVEPPTHRAVVPSARWEVGPKYWLVVFYGVVSSCGYELGSFLLPSIIGGTDGIAKGGAIMMWQRIFAVLGCLLFGWLSDHLMVHSGLRSRTWVGICGCLGSALPIVALVIAQQATAHGAVAGLVYGVILVRAFSEEAPYVGVIQPLLLSQTKLSCAGPAVAVKTGLDTIGCIVMTTLMLGAAQWHGASSLSIGMLAAGMCVACRGVELFILHQIHRGLSSMHWKSCEAAPCSDF